MTASHEAGEPGDRSLIHLSEVWKTYRMGRVEVHALSGIDLDIHRGEYVAVMGPSGSGKSTLLHVLGCLDSPTRGTYLLDGRPVGTLSPHELARVRNRAIGFVFQDFHLLPRATARENVELPLVYARVRPAERRPAVAEALDRVGLSDRAHHWPHELSGGQQQRVAIARALVTAPSILLADEPTGSLDTTTGAETMQLIDALHLAGQTVILVTHDQEVASHAQRIIALRDGRIISDVRAHPAKPEGTP